MCRVRIFFLSSKDETKEWLEISEELENPVRYDGTLVKFRVQGFSSLFSRYTFLLDWTIDATDGFKDCVSGIIAYVSSILWSQLVVANFFAYFKPTERLNSRCILFLLCCPAHLREEVKQELENEGITHNDTTSRRNMMPGCDKAFVFVSGGVRPACEEDIFI
ncbi:PREDICTED: uncharacterized protein LOC107356009 [Acropora digitifera]|uniref:uncharacterized protein LOC107356009 n=1 Tax=Acropora digitifera TaxID=70779 RepID=UPI00077A170F|nr:PREDICTED: uncharacterized protein LOC107356009 [Acropora digitifera]